MKLVLDTNVLIAAFVSHGTCNELLEHCAINHEIVLSSFILDEVKEKLVDKFEYSIREAGEVIHLLKSRVQIVSPQKLDKALCRDPDNDAIIGTALAGNCECIVTGDKDILTLHQVDGIRIVTPSDFWAMDD